MSGDTPETSLFSHHIVRGKDPKKSVVVLIRWVLIVACSCLVLFANADADNRMLSHSLILFLIVSNLILVILPGRFFRRRFFDHSLVAFDILLVTACIWSSGQLQGELYLLYFLILMIAALSSTFETIIWSTLLVTGVYICVLISGGGLRQLSQPELLIRVPFFFVVALFYGYFAQRVRLERSEKAKVQKKLSVTGKVREMSRSLERSLDRDTILVNLTNSAFLFTGSQYSAVFSRGAGKILDEKGELDIRSQKKRAAMLQTELERRIASQASSQVLAVDAVSPSVDSKTKSLSESSSERVCFSNGRFSFLPVNAHVESDLYLCLMGNVDDDLLEYVGLLLMSASMALHNAGQYQELVHEVEKRKEVVKRLQDVLKFKSDFVANISHEIRTPLHSFIGFAELLVGGGYGSMTEEQEQVIQRMLGNAQGLLELINNILDSAKLDAGEYELRSTKGELDTFVDEIRETCSPLIKDKAVTLYASCDIDLPAVVTDWTLLRQIALNLVSNAIKFTLKGRVDMRVGYHTEDSQLYFSVKDTGIGMSKEQVSVIFEPFRQLENSYTKKYAGTGLGLSITKRQVELLGGSIDVHSSPDHGSEFNVRFPVALEEKEDGSGRTLTTSTHNQTLASLSSTPAS